MLLVDQPAQSIIVQMFSMANIDEIVNFAETIIYSHSGRSLNNLQRVILQHSLLGTKKTYEQIANEHGYSENYIQQVVATKLWKILSEVIGEKITKANVRSVLERNIKKYNEHNSYSKQETEVGKKSNNQQKLQLIKEKSTNYQISQKNKVVVVYPHQEYAITIVQNLVSILTSNYEILMRSWENIFHTEQSLEQVAAEIKESDYLIILLEQESFVNEKIREIIQKIGKNQQNRSSNKPLIITIRIQVSPDSSIDEQNQDYLTDTPQWKWSCSSDTPKLIEEILTYFKVNDENIQLYQLDDMVPVTQDENVITTDPLDEEFLPPLIEPEIPIGSVPLISPFYVERNPYEYRCYQEISKPGALIRIKAPKQMGKTSLLNRILAYATSQNYQTVLIDFQQADHSILTDTNKLLRWLCANVSRQLELEIRLEEYWDEDLGGKMSCSLYFQEYILKKLQAPLILALEEVNQVFENPHIAKTLLSLLYSWHEESKFNFIWQKLRLVLVQSTEVYISLNLNQSPSDMGLEIDLPPFGKKQVQQLAKYHDLDLKSPEIDLIMNLLNGHPYLVRLTFYHLATRNLSLQELIKSAATDTGIYSDHLRNLLWQLQQNPDVAMALKQVLEATSPITLEQIIGFKLKSMGLVRLDRNQVNISCDLYQRYFSTRLMN